MQYTTSMSMCENALYYPIMNEHACDENACEWLRMYENHPYSGRGVGHSRRIYTRRHPWVCVRMHSTISLWMNMHVMRMHENDWECVRITHIQGWVWVIRSWYALDDIHDNVWECITRSHQEWTCMWWECMRMIENVWESLIPREGCGSFEADMH